MSSYNGLQVSLHHPMSHGLQLDVNYTFSKSFDFGSDAERVGPNGGTSAILDTWKPYLNKAVSDFDTAQLLTANLVDELPLGKGRTFLAKAGPITNALIGGWQFSRILRVTSGLSLSFFEPGYTTDWQAESSPVVTDNSVKAKKYLDTNSDPQYFTNPTSINQGIYNGTPIRLPYAGEAGERNKFRGDAYFDIDSGLSKTWIVSRHGALKLSWEVYNVSNSVRFNPFSINTELTSGTLGVASSELTSPRRMQFALRYDF